MARKIYMAVAVAAVASSPIGAVQPEPQPIIVVLDEHMLRTAPEYETSENSLSNSHAKLYYDIKRNFRLSNKDLASWLGTKNRTIYNWLNNPLKVKNSGPTIENRLHNLSLLKAEMETEHLALLKKVAFSPIYGDPTFGNDILLGLDHTVLTGHYERLYGKFEAYRKVIESVQA